mgnify:CR=1 FL=1
MRRLIDALPARETATARSDHASRDGGGRIGVEVGTSKLRSNVLVADVPDSASSPVPGYEVIVGSNSYGGCDDLRIKGEKGGHGEFGRVC